MNVRQKSIAIRTPIAATLKDRLIAFANMVTKEMAHIVKVFVILALFEQISINCTFGQSKKSKQRLRT